MITAAGREKIEDRIWRMAVRRLRRHVFYPPSSMFHLPKHFWLVASCAVCLIMANTPLAWGMGSETSRQAEDLQLTVDTRWAGGAYGGYYPIRIRVTNLGESRVLMFRFRDVGSRGTTRLPTVQRLVSTAQNATEQFTLSIPLVSEAMTGELEVLDRERILEKLSIPITLPDRHRGGPDRPALLVISGERPDLEQFEIGATAAGYVTASTGGMGSVIPFSPAMRAGDHEVIMPNLLPENWIDYSALDIVALSLATLGQLSNGSRSALLKWVETGGTLLVYEVGRRAAESKDLQRLLDLNERGIISASWQAADPKQRLPLPILDEGTGRTATWAMLHGPIRARRGRSAPAPGGAPDPPTPLSLANASRWTHGTEIFAGREIMLGRVFAFEDNPFPGAGIDWAWWLTTVGIENWRWGSRHGNSGREQNTEFAQFGIEGVQGVPRVAFLALISVFTVMIGPLNYFVLWRKKQLYLLVITIPVIAALTSGVLFGYAALADGFRAQSNLRSFTLLDQPHKTAVSVNRIALYAGLAPSAGLHFSPDTEVVPIWPDDTGFESGTVDWTNTQHLSSGWLRSRMLAQFETLSHRAERARIEILPAAEAGRLRIANGFKWDIGKLLVKDDSGHLYLGHHISAGGSETLSKPSATELQDFTKGIESRALNKGSGSGNGDSRVAFDFGFRGTPQRSGAYGVFPPRPFAGSQLEQHLNRLTKPGQMAGELPLRSYIAVFRENPGIELGVERTRAKAGLHVVMGHY